jgi:sugar lactone lactonase YvrE
MTPQISIIGQNRCRLGESPVWDPDLKRLFWVDVLAPAIWSYDPATGAQTSMPAPDLVGSIVLGAPGSLIVGLRQAVSRLDLASAAFAPILTPPGLVEIERLNDGKTDRRGRFLTGSLVPAGVHPPPGKLFRFAPGRSPEVLANGIEISNAICFSPAGDRLYFADSLRMAIWTYAYDPRTGELGPRETLIDTTPLGSAPDGATVDAEGRIWVALVQGGQVACITPEGRVERRIDLPVPFPSCPAFGGEALDTLYVTAIADSGGRLVSDHPDAGRLMAVEGLGVTGIAETRCRL